MSSSSLTRCKSSPARHLGVSPSSLTRSLAGSLTRSLAGSLTRSLAGSLTRSLAGSLTRSLAGSLTYTARKAPHLLIVYSPGSLVARICRPGKRFQAMEWTGLVAPLNRYGTLD